MKYSLIVETYEKIESTTKRLEITDYLVNLFKQTPKEIIDKVVYLTQGKLYPDFVGIELGIAEKLAIKALSIASGKKEDEINEIFKRREERLKLLIINNKMKRRIYIFRMDDVIKFLIRSATNEICFTEKGIIKLGEFVTIQRKGGDGRHISIPKIDWSHPGNQLQFKFSPLKFAEYVESTKVIEFCAINY